LHHRRREAAAVQAQAEALLPLASAQGWPFFVGAATCYRGWALAMQGQGTVGLALLRQGMAAIADPAHTQSRPRWLILLAGGAGRVGRGGDGRRLRAEAKRVLEANGRGDLLAGAYRLQGELVLRQPRPDAAQAEACLQQALDIARQQHAKSWELRAAVSLSRLWQQQGKRTEAYELLAPIYDWVSEGFYTAGLPDAS